MKNSIHKQDIIELCNTLGLDSVDKNMALHILEEYSTKSAYNYINLCVDENKTRKYTLIQKTYKLFTQYIKQLKNN